jgi:hypothetical protein
MPSRPSAQILPFRPVPPSADLNEALDALDLMGEVLRQAIGKRPPTGLQRAALGVIDSLKQKHNRELGGASSAA